MNIISFIRIDMKIKIRHKERLQVCLFVICLSVSLEIFCLPSEDTAIPAFTRTWTLNRADDLLFFSKDRGEILNLLSDRRDI